MVSAALVSCASLAHARPGGGQSFSSKPSGSGSRSFGSGGFSAPSHSDSSWSSPSTPSHSDSAWSHPSTPSFPSSNGPSQPTYTPHADPEAERELRVQKCRAACFAKLSATQQAELAACEEECRRNPPPPEVVVPYYESPESQESSMTAYFVWPFGLLAVAAAITFALRGRQQRRDAEWASENSTLIEAAATPRRPSGKTYPTIEAAIAALRAGDEWFSWVLFEDFVYALYTEAHTLRATSRRAELGAYLAPEALATLGSLGNQPVSAIIIGAMRVEKVEIDTARRRVIANVAFESNYTDGPQSFYVRETWVFSRSVDAKARPIERARAIDCPSCGAPLEKIVAGKCGHCGAVPGEGNLDWRVDAIVDTDRQARGPLLIGTTEEVGTDLPTVVAPDVTAKWASLIQRDPAVGWSAFLSRLEAAFSAFHASWSSQDLRAVRPFLSDNLFETQKYWVAAYVSEGLRNITESPTIAMVHLSRITTDARFDAVTVRVFATCKDFTLDAEDHVVGGDRDHERRYSEYWTFIRGAGARGEPKAHAECPSCGAPASEVDMAGTCGHCGVKITNGTFDWVLSRIEQDEVYTIA